MTNFNFPETDRLAQLRSEIAMQAARLIAEEGCEYSTAKRRAAKQVLGNQKINGNVLPDNQQIEQEVREYHALFCADTQPQRLRELRLIAIEVMEKLSQFNPYLIGAAMNGTAGEHSDIYLHLYTENAKDLAIFLLNLGIDFEVSEHGNRRGEASETLSFMFKREAVHLMVHDFDDLKHTDRNERADLNAVKQLLAESE
ncbi:hypothetical protein RF679_12505 [Undibacterium cyanobacteriorum]|uniref:UDP-N-acetylmuramate--alanine ligase n=1 Tax=Undibacterium cyanobacteriorum TaxID=3073561 RepID=A0ABY9RH94_9BURK|nr:hypothetical protein [Undibacterium sp. 20NA77.5]WMW79466.1 hypothetical protein RF679_12505 [Undibacterium sp. 20NA77.5]